MLHLNVLQNKIMLIQEHAAHSSYIIYIVFCFCIVFTRILGKKFLSDQKPKMLLDSLNNFSYLISL